MLLAPWHFLLETPLHVRTCGHCSLPVDGWRGSQQAVLGTCLRRETPLLWEHVFRTPQISLPANSGNIICLLHWGLLCMTQPLNVSKGVGAKPRP